MNWSCRFRIVGDKGEKWIIPMKCVKGFRCSVRQTFSGKKDAKPVGWMSDPDQPGPIIVDRKTLESLLDDKTVGTGADALGDENVAVK